MEPELPASRNLQRSEVVGVLKTTAAALAGFALFYCIFFALSERFPYMRPGDNLVADMKHQLAKSTGVFLSPKGSKLHVVAFGFSKTLTGFVPAIFDKDLANSGYTLESYNFGLPGDERFVADLEAMAAHGTAPDIALLTMPWPAALPEQHTVFHFIQNDEEVMDAVFPFRHRLRDFFIFASEARCFACIPQEYEESRQSVLQIDRDRGYYFIARLSHFPHDQLPDGFSLPTDTPNLIERRQVMLGAIYTQLATVLAAHHIQCIFVPRYYREGNFAPTPPIDTDTVKVLAGQPNVDVIGPNYFLYPPHYFSDPVHANRQGASVYTHAIAGLLADWLKAHPGRFNRN